jgi:hypothetical protein
MLPFCCFSLPLIAVVTIHRSEAEKQQGESARDYELAGIAQILAGGVLFHNDDKTKGP